MAEPFLALVEMAFSEEGEAAFVEVLPQMESEIQAIPGCLEYRKYRGPGGEYLFFSVWDGQEALDRWVANEFHRQVLMPGFRKWCTLGWFGFWDARRDDNRARKCMACGRWTQTQPGWDAKQPTECSRCGAPFPARPGQAPVLEA
jgi:quinol monooxygenase YgiN